MLLDILRNGITAKGLIELGLYLVVILISLSVHELFHGYAAYRCGDATARNLGRLTLNPLAHIDPIGGIMMLVFGFGYAKPVPINPRNFNHYKRDLCIVSLAGPFSNLILAFFGAIVYVLSMSIANIQFINTTNGLMIWVTQDFCNSPLEFWLFFCASFVLANVSLFVFNLLPVPPLDGSRIVSAALPGKIAYYYLKYEQIIMLVMFVLLYQGVFTGILTFLSGHLHYGLINVVKFILTPITKLF